MIKFSIGIGNNTKFMFKLFGLTSGIVWHLLPSLIVGKILARKYQSFMQVPVMDYFLQLNFLCFNIIDVFMVRGIPDMEGPAEQQPAMPQANRQIRRRMKKSKVVKRLASLPANQSGKPQG